MCECGPAGRGDGQAARSMSSGRSGPGPRQWPGDDAGHLPDGLGVGHRGDRKARLDDVAAQGLEVPGQADFLVNPHGEAGGLLAVPEGRVENDQPRPVTGVRHGTISVPGGWSKVKVMIFRLV
jgi:hypothetical protein